MSAPNVNEEAPLPEYEVGQYFPRSREFTPEQRSRLRGEYGWIRTIFKTRPERYAELQRWLNQARMGTTYDIYMTRVTRLAILAAVFGALFGVGLTYVLASIGVTAGLRSPLSFSGSLAAYIESNRLLFIGLSFTSVAMAVLGAGTYLMGYYYPRSVASTRARNIEVVLPHAITYMYAMSYGGMNLVEVIRSLSTSVDTYGEVANEFDMIVRDTDLFGNDIMTALRNARNLTASDSMEQFVDDLLGVVEAGGDVTAFFRDQSDNYLENAKEEQEDFLETLSIMSEVFIVGFIAAPLFLIVTLMVISFLGGSTISELTVLIYVGLPLGMLGFLLLIVILSAPYVEPRTDLTFDGDDAPVADDDLAADERFGAYDRSHRFEAVKEFLSDPLASIRTTPILSLVVTVPIAVLLLAFVLVQGVVEPTLAAFRADVVTTTLALILAPVLIVTVPLSIFHEAKRRRERTISRRFPDTLNTLSSANYMGIPLTEGLELVARWSSGALATELRKVRNDIDWNYDINRALSGLANRLNIPHLTRTMKLIAEGARSSGDLSKILSIAAEDTRNRYRIERARRRAMSSYIGIVVIGYLVYLMVIVLIDTSYLQPIAAAAAEIEGDTQGLPVSFTSVPIDTYRALFFHSVLIQGFGSGLLAGKLSDNRVLSGLKYSIALVLLALAIFLVI